ncbi:hypothetical protein GALMADRAFT_137742 [Galerina marginata CBS 339.88]|uniref:DUF6534 domain-containing protein n=1 Tax=Galerina marginata (strain CBS 339.88) TaxID=685588 RepID=A0A067T6G2_GALM3|nr:hypothetical protein GALMADRAFT_137742 [Galerina marginata CBS 339.88]
MNSTTSGLTPNIVRETGPRFLGYLLHWGLFGVLSTQVYMYYLAFPRDSLRSKSFVYSSYILEVIQTITITSGGFRAYGVGYGDPASFDDIRLTWFSVPLITGLVAFISQTFFAHRIRLLAQSYLVASLIMLLAVVQLAGAIASAVVLKRAGYFSRILGRDFSITAGIWNGGSALCDLIIALCMTYYLSRRKTHAMKSTQVMIKRIITLVIETGTATAVVAILTLILTVLPIHASYFETPSAVLAKVYSNSMMVVLNSRMTIGSSVTDSNAEFTTFNIRMQNETRRTDTIELGSSGRGDPDSVVFAEISNHGEDLGTSEDEEQARNKKAYIA